MITYEQYRAVLHKHPWIEEFDCGQCPTVVFDQVVTACAFLALCPKQKHQFKRRSTYSLKHDCEEYTGKYVTERSFIIAAILCGFDVWTNGRNANINIAATSKDYRAMFRSANERIR